MTIDHAKLLMQLQEWGQELGFSQIAIAPVDLSTAEPGLSNWLAQGFHGSMQYMAKHGLNRARQGLARFKPCLAMYCILP